MNKKEKILIIKTGYAEFLDKESDSRNVSFGDVLRTTPLLHLYKDDYTTWVTDKQAFPLLADNPYIERLLSFDWIVAEQLKSEEFDRIINLEKIPGICAISDSIHARRSRYGFTFNSQTGGTEAYDRAFDVLAVSSSEHAKKDNKRVLQELLFELVGEKWNGEEYILEYKPKSEEIYDIGLNSLVGKKWPTKAWPDKNWDKLEKILNKEGFKVTRQDKQRQELFKNLYSYMDWINSSKMIVSNDSLGIHLGLSFQKKVLGLFGATPSTEMCFYNRGKAISPRKNLDCIPCFKGNCKNDVFCMDLITPENVFKEIKNYLGVE